MATAIYRITRLHGASRGGVNEPIDVDVRGVAKTDEWSPYTIANELIAARIGQTLGLPVPAGVVAEDSAKRRYYLSLDVSLEGKKLPPIMPADFVAEEPRLAAGIAIFDVLVANGDRNAGNISRDPAFTPPRTALFDHEDALWGCREPQGPTRLQAATDRLGCNQDEANIARDSVLLDQPLDSQWLAEWVHRVERLPDYVFRDVCREVAGIPRTRVTMEHADELATWLQRRAARIGRLVWDNQESFPAVQWGLWDPGKDPR